MSINTPPRSGPDSEFFRVPTGDEMGSFERYLDARAMAERLLAGGVPPRAISIVGDDLTMVERVTARFGYGRAALSSALTGSWIGVFAGLLFLTVTPTATFAPLLAGGLIGAGVGMMVGMVLYSLQRQSRPMFRSAQQIIASRYRVIVDSEHRSQADKALQPPGIEG